MHHALVPAPCPRSMTLPDASHRAAGEAIETVRALLQTTDPSGAPGTVGVPDEVLRVVLSLVDGGEWDEFDGHRRWAGPWRPSPR